MLLLTLSLILVAVLVGWGPAIFARLTGLTGGIVGPEAGSVDTFIPEVWAKQLLSSLKKAHIFAALCNTDYEGEISEAGDTVRINSVGRPTIATYVPGSTTIVPEQLTTAQRSLVVDQAKYFAFEIDDVDRRQAQDGLMEEASDEAAYGFRDVADVYIESLMRAGVQSANALGAVSVPTGTPTALYDSILVPLGVLLDEADVPTEGRWAVLPPWCHGRLQLDYRFIDASKSGRPAQAMGNGYIGEAAGFQLHKSNNLPVVTGDDSSVIAGHRMACSYAEQINKTEAYRPESSFSDAIKGLHLYGAKVVRPNCLATALASQT